VLRLVGPFFIIILLLQEYRRERERAGTFTCVRSLSLTHSLTSTRLVSRIWRVR
jgi:hypothetical protein